MSPRRHSLPAGLFDSLAAGGGGAAAVRALAAAEHSKRLVLLRAVVDTAAAAGHPGARRAADAYALLARLQRAVPAAVRDAVTYPAVGFWALRVLRGLMLGDPRADPAQLAAVAAVAAVRGRVPLRVGVPVTRGRVTLPSLGAALLPGTPEAWAAVRPDGRGGAVVTVAGRAVTVPRDPHTEAGAWLGLRRLSAGTADAAVTFLVDDTDPLRFPPHPRVGPRLSPGEAAAWQTMIGRGWDLLGRAHRGVAGEVAAGLWVLVPLQAPPDGTASATSAEAFGCVAMSRPSRPLDVARALAHEVQHAKLAALGTMFPLIAEPGGERFYAPWREDPRPAEGLLQGAYAHLGIARFLRRQWEGESDPAARLDAQTEFARWREATWDVAHVLLGGGLLTGLGERFVTGMVRTLAELRAEDVPREAVGRAGRLAEEHLTRWLTRAGTGVSR
ncbi:HEXXH motif domain-containing protein [Sphaerisporangium siamense]|uniref:HEXXH motif domain-containing protein n=1 Tax=Sphaerisporangium siamense TaxID=795645 RepID=A0A7W7DGC9_9ACTN|nr:HEXXH motif domain-containing protein [Sphaerisporangium siamense]MBB4705216.1 uncharacterized protein [Sphaerisporangium siamense]GII84024.1 HEXXH motif domain-containing protein [Sphaerisporangium siamense]